MEFTREIIEKAKGTKTIEELMNLAKENNFEMTPEEAAEYFAQFHRSGELSDEELDNVSGGCSGGSKCSKCGCTKIKPKYIWHQKQKHYGQAFVCANCEEFVRWC